MEKKPCDRMLEDLEAEWDEIPNGVRTFHLEQLAKSGCQDAVPFILRMLREAEDPSDRWRALHALEDLDRRDMRSVFIEAHLSDPHEDVRRNALAGLSELFRGEADREILALALHTYDNQDSSLRMRLTAGAMMMYQLGMDHDEHGRPSWWNEDEEELSHPLILKAVEETRRILAECSSQ